MDESKPNAKHLPKSAKRFTKIDPFAAATLRLLMFTGCRLREVLNLRWEHVDLERGLLFLPDSKSGRKTIILNAPVLAVLNELKEVGPYVVPGNRPERPRPDRKRPWDAIIKHSGLEGVRLHDLQHTYASFGSGSASGQLITSTKNGLAPDAHSTRLKPTTIRLIGKESMRSAVVIYNKELCGLLNPERKTRSNVL